MASYRCSECGKRHREMPMGYRVDLELANDDPHAVRVELEPTEHPLAVEQREGIGPERIAALYHLFTTQPAEERGVSARARRERGEESQVTGTVRRTSRTMARNHPADLAGDRLVREGDA